MFGLKKDWYADSRCGFHNLLLCPAYNSEMKIFYRGEGQKGRISYQKRDEFKWELKVIIYRLSL